MSEGVGRSLKGGSVLKTVLTLVTLGGVFFTFDGKAASPQFEESDAEGMTDAADQFFGGMTRAINEDREEFVCFGESFPVGRCSSRHKVVG